MSALSSTEGSRYALSHIFTPDVTFSGAAAGAIGMNLRFPVSSIIKLMASSPMSSVINFKPVARSCSVSHFDNNGVFLVLVDKELVDDIGAIRNLDDEICELKRMWCLKDYWGQG